MVQLCPMLSTTSTAQDSWAPSVRVSLTIHGTGSLTTRTMATDASHDVYWKTSAVFRGLIVILSRKLAELRGA
jgi:hypothetical protein